MKSHRVSTYLHRRPDSQYPSFRWPVPRDVLPYWTGPKEINISLRTTDPVRSRQLVAEYYAVYHARFERLRELHRRPWRLLDGGNAATLYAEVAATLEQGVLAEYDAEMRQPGRGTQALSGAVSSRAQSSGAVSEQPLRVDRLVADLAEHAARHDYREVDPFLEAILQHLHIATDPAQVEFQSLRACAMQALLQAHRRIQLRLAQPSLPASSVESIGFTQPLPATTPASPAQPVADVEPVAETTGPTIDQLLGYWIAECGHNARTVRTMRSVTQALITFTEVTDARALTKRQVGDFKRHLLERNAAVTVRKNIGLLRAVFRLAVVNDHLTHSPFDGVVVSVPRNAPKPRVAFAPEDYHRIFSHPIFAARAAVAKKGAAGIAAFWLPLIACFSGARLEEVGQLKRRDFKTSEFLTCGVQTVHSFAIENEDDNTTKTVTSNRAVPLHPVLIRLGLLDYVASLATPDAPLFPDFGRDTYGKLTGGFSKWFNKDFLRGELGITDKRKTFHSLRHGFVTNWRACGLDKDVRMVIEGHASGSVGEAYGDMPLPRLAACMNQLVIEGFPL